MRNVTLIPRLAAVVSDKAAIHDGACRSSGAPRAAIRLPTVTPAMI